MEHELNIRWPYTFVGSSNPRKDLIKNLGTLLGTRGVTWSISKPKGMNTTAVIRIRSKDDAALVKLTFSQDVVTPVPRVTSGKF